MAGQRRSAAGTIGNDLMSLIKQAFIPYLLKCPPHRFNIIIFIRNIGIVHIGPKSHPLTHFFPFLLVFPYAMFTPFYKRFDTVFFNLGLTVYTQLLFHFQFHRKPMGVPACLSKHLIPLHGLVARYNILYYPGDNMSYMRFSVSRRRSVIKGKYRSSFPHLYTFFEYAVFLPKFQYLLFSFSKIQTCRYLFVHSVPSKIQRLFFLTNINKTFHPVIRTKGYLPRYHLILI